MKRLLKQQFYPLNQDLHSDYIAQNININNNLNSSQKNIIEDTLYLQGAMIATVGLLFLLPESITKWDTSEDFSLSKQWKENVTSGPVMDEDEFVINYIGHPVSGAIYYTMARNDGLNEFESFLYSTFMSSLVWEYGYEAFAETPSIQDLFSTPIIGAFMGEYMHYLEKELDKNSGKVWGYQGLGSFSYFLLDPMGNMADGLSEWLDISVTMKFQTYQPLNDIKQHSYNTWLNKPSSFRPSNYGFSVNLAF